MKQRDGRPVVLHVVHSLSGGGTERMMLKLLRAFDHAAIRHVLVALREAGELADRLPDAVACHALGIRGRSRIASGARLARVARRARATVIHARNTCCWADAAVAGMLAPWASIVLGFHGLESGGTLLRRHRTAARLTIRRGGLLASVSASGRALLAEQLDVPLEAIVRLPNGIEVEDRSTDRRSDMRAALGIEEDERVVGAVGTLSPVKGYDVLLEAFVALSRRRARVRLLIVGDGPLRAALEREAGSLGIGDRVCFAGRSEDVGAMLSAMDAFACASRSEGMSNAVLEAMAAGLPIVATGVGDNSLMVRDGVEGILVPPNDAGRLAGALERLIDDSNLMRSLAARARARAREFDFMQSVANYERLYRGLIEDRRISRDGVKRRGRGDSAADVKSRSKNAELPIGDAIGLRLRGRST